MSDYLFLISYTFTLFVVAYTDVRYRRISNKLAAAIGLISICYLMNADKLEQLICVPLLLVLGLLFWKMKIFAGGDVKLLIVLLPVIDATFYTELFVIVMYLWGVTAFAVFIFKKYICSDAGTTVPFGAPLAIGAWIGIFASLY